MLLLSSLFSVAWIDENPKGQIRAWLSGGVGRYESDVGTCEPDIRRRRYREVGGGLEYYFAQKHAIGMGLDLSRVTGQPEDSDLAGDLPYERPGREVMVHVPYQFRGKIIGIGLAPWLGVEKALDGDLSLIGWPCLYLRFGPLRTVYVDGGLLMPETNVGVVTRGLMNIGIGSHAFDQASFWLGLSGVPYSDFGVGLPLNFFPAEHLGFSWYLRYGEADLGTEWGATAGLTYEFSP